MKFSLASLRSNKAPPMSDTRKEVHRGDQQGVTFNAGMVKLNNSTISGNTKTSSDESKWTSIAWATAVITWAIATAAASIAWAIALYLIEREKQRAQVELARLEMEGKKQLPSN